MADHSYEGSRSEYAASEDQHGQGEHTQRNTQQRYNEPGNYPDTELGKGNGRQRPDSERLDAGRGSVQDSHTDVSSSKSEGTVGDYEKADAHLACLDEDGVFNGFSDSSSTSLKNQRKSRSKARPKARPLTPADYKDAKAAVKQRRRARKNKKRYQKKKLYGPKKDALES